MSSPTIYSGVFAALVASFITSAVSAHPGPGLVADPDGVIWATHGPSHRIWRVDADGRATVAHQGRLDRGALRVPHHLVRGPDGRLYTAGDDGIVWRLEPDAAPIRTWPPPGAPGRFGFGGDPFTIAPDGAFISVAPRGPDDPPQDRALARFRRDGVASPFPPAHADPAPFHDLGWADFAWGPDDSLYLTDDGRLVRRVTPDGTIETIAGGSERGSVDGPGSDARFQRIVGIAVNREGVIIVADLEADRIRRITPDGQVATLAGTGERGGADGPANEATFDQPVGVAFAPDGAVIVLEACNFGDLLRVRRISPAGVVSTIAAIEDP